jgi:GT2 family glycosyltransferase
MSQPLIIIPVYNAIEHVQACLASLERVSPESEILVIDDASTDERVSELLRTWAATAGNHHLIAQTQNRGFVHTANTGLLSTEADVVLLNSDTRVTPGWLEALTRCLDSVDRIATATPWTNNGEIASIPAFCRANPVPSNEDAAAVGRFLSRSRQAVYPEIPTAVGFCMAISRTAIDALGLFDEETFGHGYGEENDFSMRARTAGFRNVLCDDAYVVHHGAASFGPTGLVPGNESMQRLLSRHPGYLEIVSRFIEEDPLAPLRDDLVTALLSQGIALG